MILKIDFVLDFGNAIMQMRLRGRFKFKLATMGHHTGGLFKKMLKYFEIIFKIFELSHVKEVVES